jgi:outer membrane protein OmpA-like peptidoglycan-associated protein
VAPNENPDGSDNPDGRQLNRRVELVFVTCK